MNVVDTFRGLWRQRNIVLPGLLLTVVLAVTAWFAVTPNYERSATQLLIPGADSMPIGANPYLFLGGLSPAADVLVRAVGSENALTDVVKEYPGVQIEISRDTTTAGPVILSTVTAASDATAREVLEKLVDRTATVLNDLQNAENIVAENQVTVMPITVDAQSVTQQRGRFIAVGLAGLSGFAVTLFIASLVDGLSLNRRRMSADSRNGRPASAALSVTAASAPTAVSSTKPKPKPTPPPRVDGPSGAGKDPAAAVPRRAR